MKIMLRPKELKFDPREWHRWFAWHPVFVGNYEWRWLEYVERRYMVYRGGFGDCVVDTFYRVPIDGARITSEAPER